MDGLRSHRRFRCNDVRRGAVNAFVFIASELARFIPHCTDTQSHTLTEEPLATTNWRMSKLEKRRPLRCVLHLVMVRGADPMLGLANHCSRVTFIVGTHMHCVRRPNACSCAGGEAVHPRGLVVKDEMRREVKQAPIHVGLHVFAFTK